MKEASDYDKILTSYFSGKLNNKERQAIEAWRDSCDENRLIFKNAEKVRQSLNLLEEMRQYNTAGALLKVNKRIEKASGGEPGGFFFYWQRIAAILLLPLLTLAGIYFFSDRQSQNDAIVWQTITTPPGVKSQAQLPDGTQVWLNSGSMLSYPSSFTMIERNIKLEGEAFFDVAKDKQHPFHVDLGKISVEVLGTTFNVINYENENQTEIILTSGKVILLGQQKNKKQVIAEMQPGQKAIYLKAANKLSLQKVDTDKYTSWIDGRLIFRDDVMDEVIRRLGRWFNVEIKMADPEIAQYVYTATFKDETIEQILALLRRTAPIEYTIIPGKRLDDGSFEKQKIILKKRLN